MLYKLLVLKSLNLIQPQNKAILLFLGGVFRLLRTWRRAGRGPGEHEERRCELRNGIDGQPDSDPTIAIKSQDDRGTRNIEELWREDGHAQRERHLRDRENELDNRQERQRQDGVAEKPCGAV